MNITHLVMFKFFAGASAAVAVDVLSFGIRAATPIRGLVAATPERGLVASTPIRGLVAEEFN